MKNKEYYLSFSTVLMAIASQLPLTEAGEFISHVASQSLQENLFPAFKDLFDSVKNSELVLKVLKLTPGFILGLSLQSYISYPRMLGLLVGIIVCVSVLKKFMGGSADMGSSASLLADAAVGVMISILFGNLYSSFKSIYGDNQQHFFEDNQQHQLSEQNAVIAPASKRVAVKNTRPPQENKKLKPSSTDSKRVTSRINSPSSADSSQVKTFLELFERGLSSEEILRKNSTAAYTHLIKRFKKKLAIVIYELVGETVEIKKIDSAKPREMDINFQILKNYCLTKNVIAPPGFSKNLFALQEAVVTMEKTIIPDNNSRKQKKPSLFSQSRSPLATISTNSFIFHG